MALWQARVASGRLAPPSDRSEAPTPSYKHNAWANSRSGAQAASDGSKGEERSGEDRAVWARYIMQRTMLQYNMPRIIRFRHNIRDTWHAKAKYGYRMAVLGYHMAVPGYCGLPAVCTALRAHSTVTLQPSCALYGGL